MTVKLCGIMTGKNMEQNPLKYSNVQKYQKLLLVVVSGMYLRVPL